MNNESTLDLETDGGSLPTLLLPDLHSHRGNLLSNDEYLSKSKSESKFSNPPPIPENEEEDLSDVTLSGEGSVTGSSSQNSGLESPLSDLDLNENEVRHDTSQALLVPAPQPDIRYEDLCFIDKDCDTLLHIAVISRQQLLVEFITDVCPNQVNHQNKLFQTPLHLAVLCGEYGMVKFLLDHGADICLRDKHGRTVFHIATERNDIGMLSVLTLAGYRLQTILLVTGIHPLDIKDYNGETCLHICAKQSNLTMVQALLDKGADINIRDSKRGKSALHIAAETGKLEMVRYLLQHRDIDPEVTTYDGELPIELAYIRGHMKVKDLLNKVSKLDLKHLAKYMNMKKED